MSSFKTIAVPSRNAPRKRDAATPDLPRQAYPQPAGSMTAGGQTHRYAVGERLNMAPGGRDIARGGSICSVIFRLPFEGTTLRYRVRSETENYERIVDEKDLSPLQSSGD